MNQKKPLIAAIVIILGLVGWCVYKNNSTAPNKAAAEFTMNAINKISTWDPAGLKEVAHPILLDRVSKAGQTPEDYLKVLQKLGAIKKTECTLISDAIVTSPEHYSVSDYMCAVDYAAGPARIRIQSRKDGIMQPWKVIVFQLDSPVFAPPAAKKGAEKSDKE